MLNNFSYIKLHVYILYVCIKTLKNTFKLLMNIYVLLIGQIEIHYVRDTCTLFQQVYYLTAIWKGDLVFQFSFWVE